MPIRFYFPSTGNFQQCQPAFNSSWSSNVKHNTTGAFRLRMTTVKGSDAITLSPIFNVSATAGGTHLSRQYISDALWGDQVINGTVSGQLAVRHEAGTDNMDVIIPVLRVIDNKGTSVRGTLLNSGSYGGSEGTDFISTSSSTRNKRIYTGQSVTPVNALDGDRIVLELGCGHTAAGTTPQYRCRYGTNAPDLPSNDETVTTDGAGWFQFNNVNLMFKKNINCATEG